jgi:polyferredoxin
MRRVELTRYPIVKGLLRSRWPQLIVRAIALGIFLLAIFAGLVGTPVGNRNFAIVLVWIAWWGLLALLAVPLFGRGWCGICPIPMPGEWLQQGSVLEPGGKSLGLGRRWPNPLRNIWLQNGAFLLLALFSAVILTEPKVSALVLASFLLVAIGASLLFERRAFCRYLCPVGGFIGLYSQSAPLELRVVDASVCASHTEKTCYTGSSQGYGCPWQVFPGGLTKNTNCGLCMECLRTCPHDNLSLNVRSFGADLENPSSRKLDEAYKAFILLGSAMIYAAVMLGPWGELKSLAYGVGTLPWLGYGLALLLVTLVLVPGLFWLASTLGQVLAGNPMALKRKGFKKPFTSLAYSLVPLGMTAWMAFTLAFVFANGSYILPSLSDPFGFGWNLFGTAGIGWSPYLSGIVPLLQVVVLLAGLAWACRTALKIARQLASQARLPQQAALRMALPVAAFCLAATVVLFGLLVA